MDDQVSELIKNPGGKKTLATAIISGVVGFGIGAGLGYILGKRQKEYIHAVPAQDWTGAKDNVEILLDLEEDDEIISEGESFVKERMGLTLEEEAEVEEQARVPEAVRQSIFQDVDDTWDYEAEVTKRTIKDPYILHKDEFYSDERGYSQTTLTYYAGDDIMADQEDKPIYNYSTVVGPLNFGHGSGDQNVYHVRNDKLKAEYEILRDQGLYSVEILGLEIENNARVDALEHSQPRKFKQD